MTIGVLGGGQLGRMLALAGLSLGERFVFLDPSPSACAGAAGELMVGPYNDEGRLSELARRAHVVTFEFENVDANAMRYLAALTDVYPPPKALELSQDRVLEKQFFNQLQINTVPFRTIDSEDDLQRAFHELGRAALVKTRRFGYDGRGQRLVRNEQDVREAWAALGKAPLICEGFATFAAEVSLVCVRAKAGDMRFYDLSYNVHSAGILRTARTYPAKRDSLLQRQAEELATRVLQALDYVGVLTLEFFVTQEGLVANEMAPRVHNSGHGTIEGAHTSQFENHLRAILDLPLGETTARGPHAMVNVLGSMPPLGTLLAIPGVHVHAYGKSASPGRKVGHVTIVAESEAGLDARLAQVHAVIQ